MDGVESGLLCRWFKNCQKEYELSYQNGVQHGRATGWYENGQIEYEVNFVNGAEDGLFTFCKKMVP